MANVLKQLFTDIAAPVKEALGLSRMVKALELPALVTQALNSSGGTVSEGVVCNVGTFQITEEELNSDGSYTVEHGLGVVPEFVAVFLADFYNLTGGKVGGAFGASAALMSAFSADADTSMTFLPGGSTQGRVDITSTNDMAAQFGYITKANKTSFRIGTTKVNVAGLKYAWVAFGGLAQKD